MIVDTGEIMCYGQKKSRKKTESIVYTNFCFLIAVREHFLHVYGLK